ncbi:MAG: hypothetical protein JXA42_08975, partial [Anaerolineales bacterium]|nr:hypothetical protein [Anaerolineales bacterium]
EQWAGYCQVGAAAARLNRLVTGAFLQAGVPVLSLQPGASALCRDGKLQAMTIKPIVDALDHNLLPMVYGDVAFDEVRGGTIISTEEIFAILADKLRPARILLAGEAPGVIGPDNQVIALLRPGSPEELALSVGASHGVDVTGGMLSKVTTMLDLVERFPSLQVRIFSGLSCGGLLNTLIYPDYQTGTLLSN